jgi:hypothetical protein
MNNKTEEIDYSDHFWKSHAKASRATRESSSKNRQVSDNLQDIIFSSDETFDLHDPYSDISLFLSKKIKNEIQNVPLEKKWSLSVQEHLIKCITPEFSHRFPNYHLGIHSIKKTWHKIISYMQQIEDHTHSLKDDGSVNINFFIQENLKQYILLHPSYSSQSYHYSQQLAAKISEFSATIDGQKPDWNHLTRIIWSLQKNLLSGSKKSFKSPYDFINDNDEPIFKILTKIHASHPLISQEELKSKAFQALSCIKKIMGSSTAHTFISKGSWILSQMILSSLSNFDMTSIEKKALNLFLRRYIDIHRIVRTHTTSQEIIKRILTLYHFAIAIPKNLTLDDILEGYDQYVKSRSLDPNSPSYSLISLYLTETFLCREVTSLPSKEDISSWYKVYYKELIELPSNHDKHSNYIRAYAYQHMLKEEKEHIFDAFSEYLHDELAEIVLRKPHLGFDEIIQQLEESYCETKKFFTDNDWEELKFKTELLSLEHDMIHAEAPINLCNALTQMIDKKLSNIDHEIFKEECIKQLQLEFLELFPHLTYLVNPLERHIRVIVKQLWYQKHTTHQRSSIEKFLHWHKNLIQINEEQSIDEVCDLLVKTCAQLCPLIGLDKKICLKLLSASEKQVDA